MVNEVDLDGNGTIEFDEFLEMMASTKDSSTSFENEIVRAFATFDTDDSGYVSVEQLRAVVTNLGEKLEEKEIQQVVSCCKEKGWVLPTVYQGMCESNSPNHAPAGPSLTSRRRQTTASRATARSTCSRRFGAVASASTVTTPSPAAS